MPPYVSCLNKLDLLVIGISLIEMTYELQGICCLNLLANLDFLGNKTYLKSF